MENVSTGVLEKLKNNILEVKIKPKNAKYKERKIYYPLCKNYSQTVVEKSISKKWTNMQEASG